MLLGFLVTVIPTLNSLFIVFINKDIIIEYEANHTVS